MANLLIETIRKMESNNKSFDDISWYGNNKSILDLDKFHLIMDIKYDASYGSTKMPLDFVIVFKDNTWLERHEYDGSEWWEYKQTPTKPNKLGDLLLVNEFGWRKNFEILDRADTATEDTQIYNNNENGGNTNV